MYTPANTIYPRLAYEDEIAAIEWLSNAFEFTERDRKTNDDGSVLVWLELNGNALMVCRSGFGITGPTALGGSSSKIVCYVTDVAAHYERAVAAGAVVDRELEDTPWGERRYEATDPGGHTWHFSQRLKD